MSLQDLQAPKPGDKDQELRVIGAGYSRTGTVSFSLALQQLLNGPVCHCGSASLFREESFIKRWISILNPPTRSLDSDAHRTSTLRSLLSGYVAITDNPGIMFTRELLLAYPDAVVICTTRDPATWWASCQDLARTVSTWWLSYLFWPVPTLRYFDAWREGMKVQRERIYGDARVDGGMLERHEEYLRRVVPKEKLFFVDLKDGWEPICRILGVEVPDGELPRANDKVAVQRAFGGLVKRAAMVWLQIFVGSGVAIGVGLQLWRKGYYTGA